MILFDINRQLKDECHFSSVYDLDFLKENKYNYYYWVVPTLDERYYIKLENLEDRVRLSTVKLDANNNEITLECEVINNQVRNWILIFSKILFKYEEDYARLNTTEEEFYKYYYYDGDTLYRDLCDYCYQNEERAYQIFEEITRYEMSPKLIEMDDYSYVEIDWYVDNYGKD